LGFAVGGPYAVTLDNSGNLFVAAYSTGIIYKVDKTTGSTASGWSNVTGYNTPTGLAVDASGNLYVSSYNGGYISKFNGVSGASMTFTSPQHQSSFLPGPEGIAIEGDNLYVTITGTVAKYSLTTSQAVAGWTNPTSVDSDMIALYTAVPEPSTYALAVVATGVVASIARRRKGRQG